MVCDDKEILVNMNNSLLNPKTRTLTLKSVMSYGINFGAASETLN